MSCITACPGVTRGGGTGLARQKRGISMGKRIGDFAIACFDDDFEDGYSSTDELLEKHNKLIRGLRSPVSL